MLAAQGTYRTPLLYLGSSVNPANRFSHAVLTHAHAVASALAAQGTYGAAMREEVVRKIEKWQEPPPAKQVKPLPIPDAEVRRGLCCNALGRPRGGMGARKALGGWAGARLGVEPLADE